MKSLFFLVSLLLCFSITAPSFAKDIISLRASERDNYSRLTFGWKSNSSYKLDKDSKGLVVITFEREADINADKVDFAYLDNISDFNVASTNPLKISFLVPKSSEIRDFKIGNRLIIDVYDPKNAAEGEAFKKVQNIKGAKNSKAVDHKKSVNSKELVEGKKNDFEAAKKKLKSLDNEMPKTPPAIVLVPEHLPEIDKVTPKENITNPYVKTKGNRDNSNSNKALKQAIKQENHVISLRSTSLISMAAFENFGELWLVVGGDAFGVKPSLSSPTPKAFSPFIPVNLNKVKAYHMPLPEHKNLKIKARGGGLVWDLILGDKVKEKKSIKIIRNLAGTHNLRDGKLFIPLKYVADIIDISDPTTGQNLKVVLVDDADQSAGTAKSYIDFDILRSPVGMAIYPKVDDLLIEKVTGGIEISRPSGLALSLDKDIEEARLFIESSNNRTITKPDNNVSEGEGVKSPSKSKDFFRFSEWQLVPSEDVNHNKNLLLAGMYAKSEARKIEDILTLGKMYLSHGWGAEALGFFNYAALELPALKDSAEFNALTGVAKALNWKSDAAFADFQHKELKDKDEIKYWKSYILADLGDWQQAASILPSSYKPVYNYPAYIGDRLALVLAEVNLRDGNQRGAHDLMAMVEKRFQQLPDPQKAALKYLQGEAYRQKGQYDKTKEIWGELSKGKDDLYRVKASLALTILLANEKKIDNKQVIDRLERLRYAWRGDELEAQVHFWLGNAYFKDHNYMKGLAIMRDAAAVAGETALGHRIASNMAQTFSDLFLGKGLEKISAIDAVALYEQFSELTPVGAKGDKLVQNLAEHLVKADLLGRATKILRHQVDHRLEGKEKLRVAVRLAAIELIDNHPQKAINALGKALDTFPFISDEKEKAKRKKEIDLLRIRAYLQNKQFDKSFSLIKKLEPDKNVNRLKAEIAWQAGYWDEAADALNEVILDENISMTRPLTDEQADMILNRAIALSLDNDRIALANMRSKYNDLMLQTNKSRQFEVITRPQNRGVLADRETLLSIVSEVDLFKDFLDSYRSPN